MERARASKMRIKVYSLQSCLFEVMESLHCCRSTPSETQCFQNHVEIHVRFLTPKLSDSNSESQIQGNTSLFGQPYWDKHLKQENT